MFQEPPFLSDIFDIEEKGYIMNRLTHDTDWRKQLPWSGWMWGREEMNKWQMDDVSDAKAVKKAYIMIHEKDGIFPMEAYRLFLPDSQCAMVGGESWAVRLALAPKGCPANHIFPSPYVHEFFPKNFTPSLPT
jgi:hypothetical protein